MKWSKVSRLAFQMPVLEPQWRVATLPSLAIFCRGLAKQTTGIVGLPVDEHARENLKSKLHEVLDAVKVIPEDAEYRRAVERTCHKRLSLLESDFSDEQIEQEIGRQLEQEIKMCGEELKLIPNMAEWKPWEVPQGHKIEIIENQKVDEEARANAKG